MFDYFGMFGPGPSKAQIAQEKKWAEERLAKAVDWDPQVKWYHTLTFKASSYTPLNLFPEVAPSGREHRAAKEDQRAVSPGGTWLYVNKTLPRGSKLQTLCGKRKGTVVFDGPVNIPCLFGKNYDGTRWEDEPWMSLTPFEFLTLRAGTRKATKHVVIAGLGLGHQLIEVSRKRTVKEITLVERSQELVDWILPRVLPHCGVKPSVIVGDAKVEVPKLNAHVALIDIFDTYGSNDFRYPCPGIPNIWCWGGTDV